MKMKNKQITNTVLMIEPIVFGFNDETATNNFFQKNDSDPKKLIQDKALEEFTNMVDKLRKHYINVIVFKDTKEPYTPDSIFPNNWISFHDDGNVLLYPLYAPNRRKERRLDIIEGLKNKGFLIKNIVDFTESENKQIYLEGTGSIVLDRTNKVAYISVSERTNEGLFLEFCEKMEFTPIIFHATQNIEKKECPIYHTNVMISITEDFVIVCLDSIKDLKERKLVSDILHSSQKEIITISEKQMMHFAANCLQLETENLNKYLVMSSTGYKSLNVGQIEKINKYSKILVIDVPTIEKYGGGSVRCMMAEIFLQKIDIGNK